MLKTKYQQYRDIFDSNKKLLDLFDEFGINYESVVESLIKDVLFEYDSLIQNNTVYYLAENPDNIDIKNEQFEITCRADNNNDLNGKYFTFSSKILKYYVWYNTGSAIDPELPQRTGLEVAINTNDDAVTVAQKTATVIDSNINFNATNNADKITVTCIEYYNVEDVSDASINIQQTNFEFKIIQQGVSELESISLLNEKISTKLGLYPGIISPPHNDNYRNYKSSNGTLYTYFLKWIFYVYKFFNEEQYFFNNLLQRYVPEYDRDVISSTNNLKIYFDGLGILLDTINQKIEDLYQLGDIDRVNERFLNHIAQLLGYQKEDFSIKTISYRELIKNLISIYKTKGTSYSFKLFFKLLGFDIDLREYYWDRDAKNPEGFASITPNNYLYYLTVQDPRTRTKEQIADPSSAKSIQPIDTKYWTTPKDLRKFNELQSTYTLDQILGFEDSDLPEDERFTYFKTNFINFRLIQFFTKQDLTAKDTNTILKYVKFLTPIYVSALVEVVTTPWEDIYNPYNPEASNIIFNGDPGDPPWVDILLPFVYITLREYIPLQLEGAPENAVVIANTGTTDDNGDDYQDDALHLVFGTPKDGISILGDFDIPSTIDASVYKYISIKLDDGKGKKITINGANCPTYQDLVNEINSQFSNNSVDANAMFMGSPYDIRIESNTAGINSKIYLIDSDKNGLFTGLSTTLDTPVDGYSTSHGYQELGLTINNVNDATNLDNKEYSFYINIDYQPYKEVDISGVDPVNTTSSEVVSAINNFYYESSLTTFTSLSVIEYINLEKLTDGKIIVAYRDVTTNSGKLIILDQSGTIIRVGINFSLSDVRNVTTTSSINEEVKKFFIAFYDTLNNKAKWSVFNNDGNKITTDKLFTTSTFVDEIKSLTLSNNRVALIFNKTSPASGIAQIIDINNYSTLSEVEFINSGISNLSLTTNNMGFVVAGNTASGGILVYLDESAYFAINSDQAQSTKIFDNDQVDFITLLEYNDEISVIYRKNTDKKIYFTKWDNSGNQIIANTLLVDEQVENIKAVKTYNNNIFIIYKKISDGKYYNIIIDFSGNLVHKGTLFLDYTNINDIDILGLNNKKIISAYEYNNSGMFDVFSSFGEIAKIYNNKLQLNSLYADKTWDDNVENYAEATDNAHKVEIDGQIEISDRYSTYYRNLGIDFTQERNRFNTFYSTSPDDDIIDLIEDALELEFTLLIGSNDFPYNNVDALNFYISRNQYINKDPYEETNAPSNIVSLFTKHLEVSKPIEEDLYRIRKEISWPIWNKQNTSYNDWSTWNLALDNLLIEKFLSANLNYGRILLGGFSSTNIGYVYLPDGTSSLQISNTGTYYGVQPDEHPYYEMSGIINVSGEFYINPIFTDYEYKIANGYISTTTTDIFTRVYRTVIDNGGLSVVSGDARLYGVWSDNFVKAYYFTDGGGISNGGADINITGIIDYIYRIAEGEILCSGNSPLENLGLIYSFANGLAMVNHDAIVSDYIERTVIDNNGAAQTSGGSIRYVDRLYLTNNSEPTNELVAILGDDRAIYSENIFYGDNGKIVDFTQAPVYIIINGSASYIGEVYTSNMFDGETTYGGAEYEE